MPSTLAPEAAGTATSSTAEQLVSGYLSEDRQRHADLPRGDPDGGPGPR